MRLGRQKAFAELAAAIGAIEDRVILFAQMRGAFDRVSASVNQLHPFGVQVTVVVAVDVEEAGCVVSVTV